MTQQLYNLMSKYCSSIGLRRTDRRDADEWRSPDGSLTCMGMPIGFGAATGIRWDSTDGSYGLILVTGCDLSVFDAAQGPGRAHSAVDACYGCRQWLDSQLNPPRDLGPRSAH